MKGNASKGSVIIDAQGKSRIFSINLNLFIIFINISFINTNTTNDDEYIYNNGSTLNILDCNFKNNFANNGGTIMSNGENNLFINDFSFDHNNIIYSDSQGGAIYNSG